MNKLAELKEHLKPGQVYHRADLKQWSTSVDRHLQELLQEEFLEKLSGGLYYVPRQTVFGKAPAKEEDLVKAFLKDDRFVVLSPNDYNALGVGATQLYNERWVYNLKRHGVFKLGNRSFRFIKKQQVPDQLTAEFLMVDLVNNASELAEDTDMLLENVKQRAVKMDTDKLKKVAHDFGKVRTRKLFTSLLAE